MTIGKRQRAGERRAFRACLAGLVVALTGVVVLVVMSFPVAAFSHQPLPLGGQLSFAWSPPRVPKAKAATVLAVRTPADSVLVAAVGDGTFTNYPHPSAPVDDIYGGPYAADCTGLLDPVPMAGVMRRVRQGSVTLAVTAWAYTAGGGAAAVVHAHDALASCSAPAGAQPHLVSAPAPARAGFVATSSNGGDGVAWMAWARGDVVLAVSGTVPGGAGPLAATSALATRVDAAALAAMATTCLNPGASAQAATRNPYLGSYQPYHHSATLRVNPVSSQTPISTTPTPGPGTPGNLPGTTPTGGTAGTTGQPDTQSAARTAPEPVPELAPLRLPEGWTPGQVVPAPKDAERGPAPVLVRPGSIPVPEGVLTTEPTAPGQVPADDSVAAFSVSQADTSGPGCGWDFTGTRPAAANADVSAATTRGEVEKAFWKLALQQAQTKLDAAQGAYDQGVYATAMAGWNRYQSYQSEVAAAQGAWDAAHKAYQESVTFYDATYQAYLATTAPIPPGPSNPTSSPSPGAPVPPPGQPTPSQPTPSKPTPSTPTDPAGSQGEAP